MFNECKGHDNSTPVSVSPTSLLCHNPVAEGRIDMGGVESLQPEMHGTDAQQRFACIRATRIILAETTTTSELSTGAFHHPTCGQPANTRTPCKTSHHFHSPVARGLRVDPVIETIMMVLVIGPHQLPRTNKSPAPRTSAPAERPPYRRGLHC